MVMKILTILSATFFALCSYAQKAPEAKKLLDATASKLQKMKSIEASFTLTSFKGTTEQGSTQGTILLSGKRYQITTPEAITWFDGKTQWSYIPDNEEVNLSTPTKAEQAAMNPYAFITLYKKGFNYTTTPTTYNGNNAMEVRLTSESSSSDIQEALIVITPDHVPVSVRIRQGSSQWTRIRIASLRQKKTSDSDFVFHAEQYPHAEIIDLR
ncbi:MAG: hypothetical protein KBT12_05400 [Bacteroidales bacterium]|nr:hypothetical protein [Candidatus Physcousia equi]